ncbi:hypothetical protein POPTR_005G029900v4 [Populus trichocarpa]|uniref:Uncharacterized protein n=1 Tax=Populus trichocarpa TaxID=3694 RepID=A0ACC0SYF5_POPTR|nr:hypothetical protein POPTR_005G029900v4 [Populus trichocarpa]
MQAGPYDSMKDISLKILQSSVSTVPIIHSASQDGSFPQLLYLASLSGILKCISRYFRHSAGSFPILQQPICNSLVKRLPQATTFLFYLDITALAKDKAYAQIHLDEISIHQALQLGQNANSSNAFYNGQRCQMCLRTDSLHKVMERLANPGVRRLLIVEAGSKRVEGVISLSDVFRFLLGI